jgi:NADH dehydrogenase
VAPEFEEKMAAYIVRKLTEAASRFARPTPVERIEHDRVILKGGEEIVAETITGAMGVTPSPLVQALPVEKSRKGAVVTDAELRVKDRPGVVGDRRLRVDPVARRQALPAARPTRAARGESARAQHRDDAARRNNLKPFIYETKGLLASLGHHRGVGRIGKFRVYGFIGWWVGASTTSSRCRNCRGACAS